MNNNQKLTITLIAATVALVGVLVGILAYFKKKADELDDNWNFSSVYDGVDYDFDCGCGCGDYDDFDNDDEDDDMFVDVKSKDKI